MASIATCFSITAKSYHHHHYYCKLPYNIHFQTSIHLRNSSKSRFSTVSFPVIKSSSIDIPAAIKPGGRVETDGLPTQVRKRAMEAVDSFGGRVTIGDVSSKAGLKVNEAQRALQALASDTGGFLEVSDEGDVLYVFPKDYRTKLAAKSFRLKIEPLLEKSKSVAEYVIRVSFGTALIASIVIVYTTIIVLLSSSKSDEDNRGRRGGRSYDSGVSLNFYPTDLFWYWDPYYYKRQQKRTDDDGTNFIGSVFSFVFGDGDPNQGIEEERWKLIGQYITSNGGVVTAEELAPYLDVPPTDKNMDDESYILPVLLRFDGRPDVDEEGNILYRFPSLQRTASSQRNGRKEYVGKRWAEFVGGVDKFFKEKQWQFSKTKNTETAMVIGLGGLNLFGVIILGTMLKNTAVVPSGFISFVADIFPLLQIYAGSFFAIPLFRWFLVRKTNSDIDKRNKAREQRARLLELPDQSLRRKILSARDMAQRTVIGQDRIVYSTERDLYDQDFDAREWDQRFQEIEKSD
ncbi:Iron-sulfur cluster biosynthesis family protein [Thalictrum thalictroides]|uniref:Iron-sulfur cluster biosynthesis family protein n=1 Tax=Thalictrum thalictroides TaxID=46969 RepID=A0A7J6XEW0_THATH|nr:Iron-sulfur cluster biosynthesis family protein [Thalictrum thalictroides]